MASALPIQQLPPKAVAQLRSSVAITSLNAVVIELLKNSLDAHSDHINLSIEYPRGSCTVEDDGHGILPSEFLEGGGLAKPHHTSKYETPSLTYGRNGQFMASLADLSIVTITSRHQNYRSCNTLTINHSRVISRQTPSSRTSVLSKTHGTCVTVSNLFGNMPVRVKQRSVSAKRISANRQEWDDMRAEITNVVLSWPRPVDITVRDVITGEKLLFRDTARCMANNGCEDHLSIEHICSTLWQAKYIQTPEKATWVRLKASTDELSIRGAFSINPVPTKGIQFISLGIHPLRNQSGRHFLYEEINQLFTDSSFGDKIPSKFNGDYHRDVIDTRTAITLGEPGRNSGIGSKKEIDRWPMFFITIDTADNPKIDTLADAGLENNKLASIADLLRTATLEFLQNNMYIPKRRKGFQQSTPKPMEGPSSNFRAAENVKSRRIAQEYKRPRISTTTTSTAGYHKEGPDLIRINVQLPSFKHGASVQSHSPFDGWSRIKSGKGNLAVNSHANCDSCRLRPETAPSSHTYMNNIVAESGQITRAPFERISQPPKDLSVQPATFTRQRPHSSMPLPALNGNIARTSLLTKDYSLFNERTGMVINTTGFSTMHTETSTFPARPDKSHSVFGQGTISYDSVAPELSEWVRNVVTNWENPVFPLTEVTIPQATLAGVSRGPKYMLHGCGHDPSMANLNQAFGICSADLSRFSRKALREAQVISQVDHKFILIKMSSDTALCDVDGSRYNKAILVIIDQHAADERCRIEQLMAQLCTKPSAKEQKASMATIKSGILTTQLDTPLCTSLSNHEWMLLRTQLQHFADWGILFDANTVAALTSGTTHEVRVISLPPGIVERCKAAPKLLSDLIRSEIWKLAEGQELGTNTTTETDTEQDFSGNSQDRRGEQYAWVKNILRCPEGIIAMLNSRSCRSAIMFNDELSFDQCQSLVSRLADCAFPFQCAHGRPSMIPLVDVGTVDQGRRTATDAERSASFGKTYKKWSQTLSHSTTYQC